MAIPLKNCSRCELDLPLGDFNRAANQKSGLRPECRYCRNNDERKWRNEHKTEIALAMRKTKLKVKFGMTLEQYEALYKKQTGRCAICGRNRSEFKTALSVDHDHTTGKVRGLLCHDCNTGLGKFGDSVFTLNLAADYLLGGYVPSLSH